MASNSKRAKACVEDRISDLPQEVLCHILSQFSTRDAVKTSAVSKRWKNLWSFLNNLDFNEYEFREGYSILSHRFVDFVDRVLLFRDSTIIHRFRLQCTGSLIHDSLLDRWICTAVRRNVVELDLSMGNYCPYRNSSVADYCLRQVLELPKSLFTCNTLVKLKLLMDPKISANNAPTSNGFPSLKFLHVTLHYPNSNSAEKLISCCAALEDLVIDGEIEVVNIGAHCFNLKISAPKVKRLQISLQLDDLSSRDINCHCRTYIDANVPNLEELDICYDFLVSYSLKNVKFLSKVKIDFKIPGIFVGHTSHDPFFGHADRVRRLFAEISHVKHLSLSTYMLMVLGSNNTEFTCWPKLGANIGFQCLPPTFINLQSLEIQLKTCYCWQSLMNLLRISPNLEHLVVENDIECTHSVADRGHEWHPPKFVAACLVSHLKTICLRRFQGTRNEKEVAKYLMKHGEVLKEVKLFYLCGKSQLVSNSQLRCML